MRPLLLLLVLLCLLHLAHFQSDNGTETDDKQKQNLTKKLQKKLQKKLLKGKGSDGSIAESSTEGAELNDSPVTPTLPDPASLPDPTPPPPVQPVPEVPDTRPVRTRLRDFLLRTYDKNIHPVFNHTDKVQVNLGMALIHLDLNEIDSVLEVDSWLRLSWKNEFLSWNSSLFEGIKQIHFGHDEIWKPDIQLYNSADSGKEGQFGHTHFLVYSSGEVLWVPPAKFRAFCRINLKLWPLETQICKLKFGSWTSHGDQIDLGLYHNLSNVERLNFYTDNKEWEIITAIANKNQAKYDCCPELYPDVTFQFFLQRKSPLYRCAIILPCLVTMLLVVSSFLLPPTAGEKILVNATCFLVCILYLIYFLTTLPAHSDQIPLIVLFYSNTAALVGIAIVLNICCLTLTRDKRYSSPPKFVQRFFTGCAGRVLCLGHYYHQVSSTHHRLVVEMDSVSESPESDQTTQSISSASEGRKQQEWVLVAAGIERFFFLIYTIAFGVVSSAYV